MQATTSSDVNDCIGSLIFAGLTSGLLYCLPLDSPRSHRAYFPILIQTVCTIVSLYFSCQASLFLYLIRLVWAVIFTLSSFEMNGISWLVYTVLCAYQPHYVLFVPAILVCTTSLVDKWKEMPAQVLLKQVSNKAFQLSLFFYSALFTVHLAIQWLSGYFPIFQPCFSYISSIFAVFDYSPSSSVLVSPNQYQHTTYIGVDFGVFWYLKLLMLSPYASYFSGLVMLQAIVQSLLVSVLAITHNKTTKEVNGEAKCVHRKTTLIPVFLLYLSIQYYSSSPDIHMIFLTLSLLSNRDLQVLSKMKSLPILVLTLITTHVVSYVMKYLWLDLNTGNANFLFFQGLCMWVAYGLFIIEYIKAMVNNTQDLTRENEAGEEIFTLGK